MLQPVYMSNYFFLGDIVRQSQQRKPKLALTVVRIFELFLQSQGTADVYDMITLLIVSNLSLADIYFSVLSQYF